MQRCAALVLMTSLLVPLVVVHLPPTVRAQRDGVPVEWRSVDLFHVRDGKLSEHWVHEVDQDLVDRFWS